MKEAKVGTCYLCGADGPVTDDHVLPQSLFTLPLPDAPPIPKAPACLDCNRGLSDDEEYFRLIVLAGHAYEHPVGRELWETKVVRSFERRPDGLRARISSSLSDDPLPDDVELRGWQKVKLEWPRFERVVHKIVRGMYWATFKEWLPLDVPIHVYFESINPIGVLKGTQPFWSMLGGATYGDQVVTVRGQRVETNPSASLWYFLFYKGSMISVATGITDEDK